MKILLTLLFFMVFSTNSFSQNIKNHQWNHRVLLIIADTQNNSDFNHQIKILEENLSQLVEREIVVYQITKNEYAINFDKKWNVSSKLYQQFNPKKEDFKILLMGLDGGIKLDQTEILSINRLLTIIDGMPIRRRELKNNP